MLGDYVEKNTLLEIMSCIFIVKSYLYLLSLWEGFLLKLSCLIALLTIYLYDPTFRTIEKGNIHITK
jgi:hypothetical protein